MNTALSGPKCEYCMRGVARRIVRKLLGYYPDGKVFVFITMLLWIRMWICIAL